MKSQSLRRNLLLLRDLAFVSSALLFTQTVAHPADKPSHSDRPNIVFILADDLGYGDLGCYGQKEIRTPHLDQMAAEGMRFTQFYAGSTVCAPSRCVLMTGKHVGHAYIRGNAKLNLRPEDLTVAEVLKQAGYSTGLFGKWGLGHEGSTGVPTQQGFDEFLGYLDQTHAHNYFPTFLVQNEKRLPLRNLVPNEGVAGQGAASSKVDYSPDIIRDAALKFLDSNKERPFFLYFASTLPHANNEAGKKGMEIPDYGIYADKNWPEPQKGLAAMISHLDSDVGAILARLKQHGLDERTMVFFSSDNGPHHEGGNDPDFFDWNGALRGVKRAMYEGGIRVPMIVRWPSRIQAGTESDHIGYFGDFMTTAAELAGVELAEPTDGLSFTPTLLGRKHQQRQHESLYWEFYEQGSRQAVRAGDWKAIRQPMLTGKTELYNLKSEVSETNDLSAQHPDLVARLEATMNREHVDSPDWKPHGDRARSKK